MSKTVLVTGGSGFIGSYVTKELLSNGYEVLILDHFYQGKRDQDAHFISGDITSETNVMEAMAHCDAFIHLAGVLGTQETIQNPVPAFHTNIFGGLNVLEAAAHYNIPGVNIAVGNHWEDNPYSISKSTVERLVKMYNAYRGTSISTVRALNAYGPGQSVSHPYGPSKVRKIVPSFVNRAINGDQIEVYGDGSQVMDMVHVRDVAKVLVAALTYTLGGNVNTSFEAGSGYPTSVLDVATEVLDILGKDKDSSLSFLPMRPGETASRPVLADLSTLTPLLSYGINPEDFVPLREGLSETVNYYLHSRK